jgi:hypothetical protein
MPCLRSLSAFPPLGLYTGIPDLYSTDVAVPATIEGEAKDVYSMDGGRYCVSWDSQHF